MSPRSSRKRAVARKQKPSRRAEGATRERMRVTAADSGRTVAQLVDVEQARLVIVRACWSGMNGSTEATYELRRTESGELAGEVEWFESDERKANAHVTLDRAATTRCLKLVAAAPLGPPPYQPYMDHTDDFPRMTVVFHVGPEAGRPGIVTLYSSSQGELRTPWQLVIGDEVFTSAGSELGRAMKSIQNAVEKARPPSAGRSTGEAWSDALQAQFPTRPGEAMSRKEANWWGNGPELGAQIYRLVNHAGGQVQPGTSPEYAIAPGWRSLTEEEAIGLAGDLGPLLYRVSTILTRKLPKRPPIPVARKRAPIAPGHLELRRDDDSWAHYLDGKRLQLGDLLEVRSGDVWHPGLYAWTGHPLDKPELLYTRIMRGHASCRLTRERQLRRV